MERRRAVAIAAATVATTLGAVAAVGANFGLLGFGAARMEPLGQINAGQAAEVVNPATGSTAAPTAATPNVTVRYEDIYLPAPAGPAAPAPPAVAPTPAGADAVTAVSVDPVDSGAVTAEDPGATTGGYERGDDHDDSYEREGGDHEDHEEEADD